MDLPSLKNPFSGTPHLTRPKRVHHCSWRYASSARGAPPRPQPLTVQPFSDDGIVVCAAPVAGGRGGGEGRPLTAVALDHDALGAPGVDPAHLDLLHIVVRLGVLNNHRQSLPSSLSEPVPQTRLTSSPQLKTPPP
jgi:hypothetical protein